VIATRSEELRWGSVAPNSAAESGALRPIISPFKTAAIEDSSTVGWLTK
jgi:hypothetical protein